MQRLKLSVSITLTFPLAIATRIVSENRFEAVVTFWFRNVFAKEPLVTESESSISVTSYSRAFIISIRINHSTEFDNLKRNFYVEII